MAKETEQMVKALKQIVVPFLKKKSFTGTYPHFRRIGQSKIDLLTFQFGRPNSKYQGAFVIELSVCSPIGTISHADASKTVPPNKVIAYDMLNRFRLKTRIDGREEWLRFKDFGLIESVTNKLKKNDIYTRKANNVLQMLQHDMDGIFDKLWTEMRV